MSTNQDLADQQAWARKEAEDKRFRDMGYKKAPNGEWHKVIDLGPTPPDLVLTDHERAEQRMRDMGYTKQPDGTWYKTVPGWEGRNSARPPLGVTPRRIWLEHRIKELSEAITRQVSTPGHAPDMDLADEWGNELLERQAEHRLCRINQDITAYPPPRPGRYE